MARPSGARCPRWRDIGRGAGVSCGRPRGGAVSSTPMPPGHGWSRKPGPEGDGTEPPKKKRYWWRFTLAAVVIMAVCAAATAASSLLYLESITVKLREHSGKLPSEVEDLIKEVHGGEPETILIFGSDKRAGG